MQLCPFDRVFVFQRDTRYRCLMTATMLRGQVNPWHCVVFINCVVLSISHTREYTCTECTSTDYKIRYARIEISRPLQCHLWVTGVTWLAASFSLEIELIYTAAGRKIMHFWSNNFYILILCCLSLSSKFLSVVLIHGYMYPEWILLVFRFICKYRRSKLNYVWFEGVYRPY